MHYSCLLIVEDVAAGVLYTNRDPCSYQLRRLYPLASHPNELKATVPHLLSFLRRVVRLPAEAYRHKYLSMVLLSGKALASSRTSDKHHVYFCSRSGSPLVTSANNICRGEFCRGCLLWLHPDLSLSEMHLYKASLLIVCDQVDPVALVVTECITITSAMRKHARWAHSSVSAILGGSTASRLDILKSPPPTRKLSTPKKENGALAPPRQAPSTDEQAVASRWGLRGKKGQSMQDNPLLSAFARLRSDLKQCKGTNTVS